jgi:hypothetical protein
MSSLALLAACGGGEEGGFFTIAPLPFDDGTFGSFYMQSITNQWRDAAASFRENSSRFRLQDGTFNIGGNTVFANPLHSSRVDYAHAVGLSGAGQVIAIVDDGFLQSHEVFAGKDITTTGNPPTANHGTMVASIAAGNSSSMVGVAPEADLILSDWGYDVALRISDVTKLTAAAIEARSRSAVAQNNSWGFSDTYLESDDFNSVFGDTDGQNWLTALREYAIGDGGWEGGVVVFAVDNNDNGRAGLMDGLPFFDANLERGWLAVGNAIPIFDDTGVSAVASLESSPCYESARWCLVADGSWVGANQTGGYGSGSGSSFAAPQVSGALALLAEAFPNLTPHQLRARLLASADNTFAGFATSGTGSVDVDPSLDGEFFHTYSEDFGHGFLDIRAALLPIGDPVINLADGTSVKTQDYGFSTGGAMGDAVTRSLEGVNLAVSDQLGGDFRVAAKNFATTAAPTALGETLAARSFGKDYRRARTAPVNPLAETFAAHPGKSLELNGPEGARAAVLMGGAEDYGVALSQRVAEGDLSLDVGVKLARDGGSLMGFSGSGSSGGASMASLTLALSSDTGEGGFFALSGEMGIADLGTTAAISSVSQAEFNALRLDLGSRNVLAAGDKLTFGVSMPIAVTSGGADMLISGTSAGGGAETRSIALDLAPQERQIDLSISYAVPMSERSEFLMEVVRAENYGNIAGVSDSAAVIGMKWSF